VFSALVSGAKCLNCCTGRRPCSGGGCPNEPGYQEPLAIYEIHYTVHVDGVFRLEAFTSEAAVAQLHATPLRQLARAAWRSGEHRLTTGRLVVSPSRNRRR
jgi:hypothetical protein